MAEPLATPVTTPRLLTVAMAGLLEDQVTVLLVALAGRTVAVSRVVAPTFTVAVVGATVTPVGGTSMTGAPKNLPNSALAIAMDVCAQKRW